MSEDKIRKKLTAVFDPDDIEWRVSRSMKTSKGPKAVVLAYVTNRAIMNRLDEVFGVDGWKNEYKEWRDKGVLCGISAKLHGEWVTKWDGAEETNIEAVKGGFSGSMKRAAVQWGIGRYLYNLDEIWVDIKDRGQHFIKDQKNNIKGYWNSPMLPDWALPSLTTEDVLNEWVEAGGKEDEFDKYVQSKFNVSRDQLQPNQLAGIQQVVRRRKGA